MRLNSESIETILERFDRRDDADADYVMAHWREAVDVYEHDGSMLDLDNIVRLETVLGDRIGYDATTGSTPLWKTSGNGWSKACSCARRRTARVGRPAPAASLSTGSADDWTNGSEPRPSTPTPATRGRPGWRTSPNATSCGLGGGRAGAGRRGPLLELPGGRNSCMEFYSRPDFISESYVEWKAGLLSEGDLERTDRADTDPLGDPRAFGATTPTR
mgnify:CR=1 FL=1